MPHESLIADVLRFTDGMRADDRPVSTVVPGLCVIRSFAPHAAIPSVYEPVFCLVLQGAKHTTSGEQSVLFRAGQAVVIGVDLPVISRVVEASAARPYVAMILRLDLDLLRALAVEMPPAKADGFGAISIGDADDRIVEAMQRLFALWEQPDDIPFLAPLVTREIYYRLLRAGYGGILRRLANLDSHASRIASAIAIIRADIAAPLRVGDLARVAGMSVSAFHAHFRTLTGTSPLQYQKQLRLNEAKRLMQSGARSISAIAFDIGYESPTQFSREFTREFGHPPRRELALRAEEVSARG
jgi:AraC-like DNA-binding protein